MTHEEAVYTLKNASWLAVSDSPYLAKVEEAIETLEAAEPVRRGRWINNGNNTWSCSQCQSWIPDEQHYYARYCLFCGAKMEEQE